MTITRHHGPSRGRCRATAHGGLVYAVATHESSAQTIEEQTADTLKLLENILNDAGSGKDKVLQATVYLRDMSMKPAMDEVWCEWIGPKENWPQRACVGADLAGNDLIEVVVTAVG
ncbi:MAG: RidA family protein [Desulfobulbia bacterium]